MKRLFALISTLFFFESISAQTIESISFTGLEHTKSFVLENELSIKNGDFIELSKLDSILNLEALKLYNLQLFHWVKPSFEVKNNAVLVVFEVQERWYFWPVPIFSLADRNFNSWWQKMDFRRIDYGLHLVHSNVWGRNNKFKTNIQEGFNKKYEAFYTIPYINKKRNIGLGFAASHYKSHFLDIALADSKIESKEFEKFPLIQNYLQTQIFYRKNVNKQVFFNTSVNSVQISDTALAYNPQFFEAQKNSFVNSEIHFLLNKRNNFSYPRTGYFASISLKNRLGLSTQNINQTVFSAELAKYTKLKGNLFLANGINGQAQFSANNYLLDQRVLGYKKNIRGYEYYVLAGKGYFLSKNELKYEFFQSKLLKLNFTGNKKFNTVPLSLYLVSHFDFAYAEDVFGFNGNILANQWHYGYGMGFHLVAYYDRVFTLEYSVNKLKEKGLFIGAKFPI